VLGVFGLVVDWGNELVTKEKARCKIAPTNAKA